MLGRTAGTLLLVLAVCWVGSCRRLNQPAGAAIPTQSLRGTNTIPADWGKLVSVSSENTHPDLVQLWFQDDAGTVRLVVYRLGTGELLHAQLFRRQQEAR